MSWARIAAVMGLSMLLGCHVTAHRSEESRELHRYLERLRSVEIADVNLPPSTPQQVFAFVNQRILASPELSRKLMFVIETDVYSHVRVGFGAERISIGDIVDQELEAVPLYLVMQGDRILVKPRPT